MDQKAQCKKCMKIFSTKYTLKRHLESSKKCGYIDEEIDEQHKKYSCKYCGKGYQYKSGLDNHEGPCYKRSKFLIDKYQKKINELKKENKKLKETVKGKLYPPEDKIEPFTEESLLKKLKEKPFTESYYKSGLIGVSNYLKDLIVFTDENGNEYPNYIVTDRSRLNFKRYTCDGDWEYDSKLEYLIKIVMKCMGDIIHQLSDEYFRNREQGNFDENFCHIDSMNSLYYKSNTSVRKKYHKTLATHIMIYCRKYEFFEENN